MRMSLLPSKVEERQTARSKSPDDFAKDTSHQTIEPAWRRAHHATIDVIVYRGLAHAHPCKHYTSNEQKKEQHPLFTNKECRGFSEYPFSAFKSSWLVLRTLLRHCLRVFNLEFQFSAWIQWKLYLSGGRHVIFLIQLCSQHAICSPFIRLCWCCDISFPFMCRDNSLFFRQCILQQHMLDAKLLTQLSSALDIFQASQTQHLTGFTDLLFALFLDSRYWRLCFVSFGIAS